MHNEQQIEDVLYKYSRALKTYGVVREAEPEKVAGSQLEAAALEVEVLANVLTEKIADLDDLLRPISKKIEASRPKPPKK